MKLITYGKNLSVYNRLQAEDYENGNGGKRRVSRLTQFIHATLQLQLLTWYADNRISSVIFVPMTNVFNIKIVAWKLFLYHKTCVGQIHGSRICPTDFSPKSIWDLSHMVSAPMFTFLGAKVPGEQKVCRTFRPWTFRSPCGFFSFLGANTLGSEKSGYIFSIDWAARHAQCMEQLSA